MDRDERKLSEFIDDLNAEKKPEGHGSIAQENTEDTPELEKLFAAARLVRSLKEPAMPDNDYPERLARNVADGVMLENLAEASRLEPDNRAATGKADNRAVTGKMDNRTAIGNMKLSKQAATRKTKQKRRAEKAKRAWFISTAAAIILAVVMLSFVTPLNRDNIVYAMEQAFNEVKAYHGIIEVTEGNGEGKTSTQGKLEVWADKGGRYYVKGLEGAQQGLTTVNNGQKKWQLRPEQKQAYIFSAFPDAYRFIFELGKEVEEAKNALKVRTIGEEVIAGRQTTIVEVSPEGGAPYRLWVDKETKLPLQKQSAMQNALQYTVTYSKIDFIDEIPDMYTAYSLPAGYTEISTISEQLVANMEEGSQMVGFNPRAPEPVPEGYDIDSIAVDTEKKIIRLNYTFRDNAKKVIILENKANGQFEPVPTSVLGNIGDNPVEIQSPVQQELGIHGIGAPYAGQTDISSIRWQKESVEYAVVGNASLRELAEFVNSLGLGELQLPDAEKIPEEPEIEVPVDLEVEGNDQKSVDAGHSPWKLNPAFVAQVFVSLKISPDGIVGDYPIAYEDLKIAINTGTDAVVEVSGEKTPIKRVYLKRLIRQDSTGIWTVVGYDQK